jgi:uncharacterized protein YycO
MNQVRPLIVCLHKGTSVISKLIRWQTRSNYSHASLLFPDGTHLESREFVGVRWHKKFTPNPGEQVDQFVGPPLSEQQYDAIVRFALEQVQKPYDYTMVARFVSRRQASREESGKWFCSELVYAAYASAGIHLLRDTQPWEVSPGLLGRSPLLTPLAQ